MSIPLDRLYNFLKDISNRDDIIIYRYWPHGSKNINDLSIITEIKQYNDYEKMTYIPVACHDQEPLIANTIGSFHRHPFKNANGIRYIPDPSIPTSFYKIITGIQNIYDEVLLVHSEKNSAHLNELERSGCRGVYWWSHAIIAHDWYRYAEHDVKLNFSIDNIVNDFLIYNRAWTGTREYRLKFAELVAQHNLESKCQMSFNPIDNNQHYKSYYFENSNFKISTDLDQYFLPTPAGSNASADYNSLDYSRCGMEVVLETLFDDARLHLTEKSLRPIACGKPFILAGTTGSLEYLKSYGFKTFSSYIDESYDQISDPLQRLQAIAKLMSDISKLPTSNKQELWTNLNGIAQYNRQHFFSNDFFQQVTTEFVTNLSRAIDQTSKHRSGLFYKQWKQAKQAMLPLSDDEIKHIESMITSVI